MNESTLVQLYQSAVKAFPNTTKRQHSTQPIRIVEMRWTPFVGIRTLYIAGRVESNGKNYNCGVLFKEVNYNNPEIEIVASTGAAFALEKLKLETNHVNLRCNCPDFRWRFNYYNFVDSSLYGSKAKAYVGTTGIKANPLELPGVCKHLMRFSEALVDAGLLS